MVIPGIVGTEVIIQARMNASRLPGKILAPFTGGRSFLAWAIERARLTRHVDRVVVATTTDAADDATASLCKELSCPCVRGSEADVLGRFADTIKAYPARLLIRCTADNPLVDTQELSRLVEILRTEHLDYVNNHKDGLPIGAGAEAFTFKAFERVIRDSRTPYEHEHVTPYFYQHPELFTIRFVTPLVTHPFAGKVRLTLDTPEDLECLRALMAGLGVSDPARQPSTADILSYLESHPEIAGMNSSVVQKTVPYTR